MGTPLNGIYLFYRDVIGYDLAGFFARSSQTLRQEITAVVEKLLGAE